MGSASCNCKTATYVKTKNVQKGKKQSIWFNNNAAIHLMMGKLEDTYTISDILGMGE